MPTLVPRNEMSLNHRRSGLRRFEPSPYGESCSGQQSAIQALIPLKLKAGKGKCGRAVIEVSGWMLREVPARDARLIYSMNTPCHGYGRGP